MAQRFRVAFLSAECVPFAKVGGLGDVAGALSRAVADLGCSVAVFLPRYGDLHVPEEASLELVSKIDVPLGGEDEPALIYRLRHPAHPAHLHHFFIANETNFGRAGVYADPATGEAFADNAARYAFFSRACLEAMRAVAYAPDVIHANDHQTALVPAYLKTLYAEDPFFQMTASLLAIHNLGYQGVAPPETMALAGFSSEHFYPLSPFEFWGRMNYFKAGIHFADVLVTVSERYAEEIQSGEEFGFGLQGTLNARRADLIGILNGIDVRTWNPRTDRFLAVRYDAESLDLKATCKTDLLERAALPSAPEWPLFGMISRLVEQKGLDLIEAAADRLFALPARWIFLGSGERRYEAFLEDAARRHPERIAVRKGFDDPLAHAIEGGADFFLMPSKYEPCGLNQMMSMRYGTVPVVRATGGLADTVIPVDSSSDAAGGGTGILFEAYRAEALLGAIDSALRLYGAPGALLATRRNGMRLDFSWEASARKYLQVYRQANGARRMGTGFNRWIDSMDRGRGGPGGGTREPQGLP